MSKQYDNPRGHVSGQGFIVCICLHGGTNERGITLSQNTKTKRKHVSRIAAGMNSYLGCVHSRDGAQKGVGVSVGALDC